MQNSAYTQKTIISAFIKTLQIKLLPLSTANQLTFISILHIKYNTQRSRSFIVIKCSVSLPEKFEVQTRSIQHFLELCLVDELVDILQLSMFERNFYIGRNNSKVDFIEIGCIVVICFHEVIQHAFLINDYEILSSLLNL